MIQLAHPHRWSYRHGDRLLRGRPSTAAKRWRFSMSVSSLQVRTQLFFRSFMYNNIHIPLNADLQKKGPISELSVQSLYLPSANGGVSPDLTPSTQFFQRAHVINGCHLRGVAQGWSRKEKVIQRRLLPTGSNTGATKNLLWKGKLKCHFQSLNTAEEPLVSLVCPSRAPALGMKNRAQIHAGKMGEI